MSYFPFNFLTTDVFSATSNADVISLAVDLDGNVSSPKNISFLQINQAHFWTPFNQLECI